MNKRIKHVVIITGINAKNEYRTKTWTADVTGAATGPPT